MAILIVQQKAFHHGGDQGAIILPMGIMMHTLTKGIYDVAFVC